MIEWSSSFDVLQARWPELCNDARRAEAALHQDPTAAVMRLRIFAERLLTTLYETRGWPRPVQDRQFDRLEFLRSENLVGQGLLKKLHAIRVLGNKAAHGDAIPLDQAADLLLDAWSVAQWFCRFLVGDETWIFPPYRRPEFGTTDPLPHEPAPEEVDGSSAAPQPRTGPKPFPISSDEASWTRQASDRAYEALDEHLREPKAGVQLIDCFVGETLTPGQTEVIEQLAAFLEDQSARVFLLKGSAGTGKTYITKGVTEYLSCCGRSFQISAPTGRAAKVIQAKTGCRARTLHSRIYNFSKFVEYTDKNLDGSETFKRYAEVAVNNDAANTVYLVDEASLVSDVYSEGEFFRSGSGYLLRDFLGFVNLDHNDHDKKVILIGDTAQLTPVGMSSSPALDERYLRKTYGLSPTVFELTDVVRQRAESGVIRNVAPLRESLARGVFNKLEFDFGLPDLSEIPVADLISRYLESCGHTVNGTSIIITRSNAEAAEMNRAVRQHLFPDCPRVAKGDKLMVTANTLVEGELVPNGEFVLVKEVDDHTETKKITLSRKNPETQVVETTEVVLEFRDATIAFRNADGHPQTFRRKLLDTLLHDGNSGLTSDQQRALYVDFLQRHSDIRKERDLLHRALSVDAYFNALRVKFGYAVTCHKAQGSEWPHVFVSCPRDQNPLSADSFRWLYTAMTRTTDRLYLISPPRRVVGGGILVTGWSPVFEPEPSPSPAPAPSRPAPTRPARNEIPTEVSNDVRARAATFGLSERSGTPFAIFSAVLAALAGSAIEIDGIDHNQYQEAYHLRRGPELLRVNIHYNGKDRIARVMPAQLGPLADDVSERLGPLVGQALEKPGTGAANTSETTRFSQPFLDEFHARLSPLLSERQIRVVGAAERPYALRYNLVRDSQSAVIDVWYDGRSVFKSCSPVNPAPASRALLADAIEVLTVGMSR